MWQTHYHALFIKCWFNEIKIPAKLTQEIMYRKLFTKILCNESKIGPKGHQNLLNMNKLVKFVWLKSSLLFTAWKVSEFFLVCIRTEYRIIWTRKNSVFEHFSRSDCKRYDTKAGGYDTRIRQKKIDGNYRNKVYWKLLKTNKHKSKEGSPL